MNKKNLKSYEAPVVELVDVELQGMLCASIEDPILAPEFDADED